MTKISSLVHLFTANDSLTVESQIITFEQRMHFLPTQWTRYSYHPLGLRMPSYGTVLYRGYCNGAKYIRQEARLRQVFSFHAHLCNTSLNEFLY